MPTRPERPDDGWLVVEDRFEASRQRAAETVFTVGNGRFSTRGSLEEGLSADQPATLMHGIFAPAPVVMRELANLPNWTALEVVVDGERFSTASGEMIASRRTLDLRSGLLRRDVRWRSPSGATIDLRFERFTSRSQPDLAAVRVSVTPTNDPASVEVHAALPAFAANDGRLHLEVATQRAEGSLAGLTVNVLDTEHVLGLAARIGASGAPADCEGWDAQGNPTVVARWMADAGQTVTCEKVVVITSSREGPTPGERAQQRLATLHGIGFDQLHAESAAMWDRLWDRSDVVIEGDSLAQLAIRFSLYHLLIAAPPDDEQVSIGAKTLSGFGYRGHVFWDTETFMLPFFIHVHPELARNFLSYRWHRLPAARDKARAGGYQGAQFPWESADSGEEVTPTWVTDLADPAHPIRIWTGDIEIHISAVVAYAVVGYWRATGDDAFMRERGAEIVLEAARFWASRAEWHADRGRYEFSDVIGPDEYHEHVDNNAFTNHLAAWHLRAAADLSGWLLQTDADVARRLAATREEADRFRSVADAIYQPHDERTGMVEQFGGYFSLQDVDLGAYDGRTRSMQAILGIEGINRTQVIKQPDVLMLAYLLPGLFSADALAANYAYYNARTDHSYGSSLGPAIQAMLAVRMGHADDAYEHFSRAAGADLRDVRGNVSEGIHGASAGGLWQALVFGFGGVRLEGDQLTAHPRLPASWSRLAFKLVHRGEVLNFDLRQDSDPAAPHGADASRVRGLIFDLDGVITDTAEMHFQAWKRLADEEGIPFDRKANEALRGISRRESLRLVLAGRHVSENKAQELMDRKNGYYRQSLTMLTPRDILPGALDLLDAAHKRGLVVALASASRNAREVIDRLGIADRFDAIADGYTVAKAKPAPDLFLAAADMLHQPPASCVVFEDASEGVAAAHAAGMTAVGIGPSERVGEAELVVNGLDDVTLDDVLDLRRHAA